MGITEIDSGRGPKENPFGIPNPFEMQAGEESSDTLEMLTPELIGSVMVEVGRKLLEDGQRVGVERLDGFGPRGSTYVVLNLGHSHPRQVVFSSFPTQSILSYSSKVVGIPPTLNTVEPGKKGIQKVSYRFPPDAAVSRRQLLDTIKSVAENAIPVPGTRIRARKQGKHIKLLG